MRMRRRFRSTMTLLFAAIAGCTSLEGLSGSGDAGTGAGEDATLVDGPADEQGRDADGAVTDGGSSDADPCAPTDSDANLAHNGGFEQGCGGPWGTYQSVVSVEPVARCGAVSCRVCLVPDAGGYTVDEDMPWLASPTKGDTYVGTAWVRAVPDASVKEIPQLFIRLRNDAGVTLEGTSSNTVILNDTWQPLQLVYKPLIAGALMDLYVTGTVHTDGACFLVDDVTLFRQ